jgi:uncharacterized membrane protein YdfJ with MMPL/SSD domain
MFAAVGRWVTRRPWFVIARTLNTDKRPTVPLRDGDRHRLQHPVTARLREELREGRDRRTAAALAIEHAGPSVAAAALILAGTFGALMVSGVPLFTQIGFAVTVGIALVSFVVSILLVPAMTALIGRPRSAPVPPALRELPQLMAGGTPPSPSTTVSG